MIELVKRYRILVSIAAVLLALGALVTIRAADPTRMRVVDEAVHAVSYPFQMGVTRITTAVAGWFDSYLYLVNLKQENERLRLQNRALEEQLNHYINSSIQFNLLREQLQFMEEDPEKKVFAEVIGESVDNFHHVLLINKGSLAGIRRNFPVVLRRGVVGRVQAVTAMESLVQLIVDRRHRFPVLIERTRERVVLEGDAGRLKLVTQDRGIVFGSGQGLQMNRIRMLADVQAGDRVVTSGLGGIFPKGLLVGVVTEVRHERHELFQSAVIRPAVDFNRIEGVFVILKDRTFGNYPLFSSP